MPSLLLNAYRLLIRPLLFALPPETAQRVADFVLKRAFIWRALSPALSVNTPKLKVDLCGLKLDNPVGLAAGYDKNCELLPSLASLGFGYIVAGTVTESYRPGNSKPRLRRYVRERSLVNALGFPSRGLEFAARQLERTRTSMRRTPVVVSVSGVTVDEIVRCHRRLEPLADAIEVNISSPNTAGLRAFHEPSTLAELIGRVSEGRNKPLFVKLPPLVPGLATWRQGVLSVDIASVDTTADTTHPTWSEARDQVLALARVCAEAGVDALTVANARPARDTRLAVGVGGLSGKLIFPDMLRMVGEVRAEVGDKVAINACGGIFSGEEARQAIQAGATTVQLLTGLIYRGPGIVKAINQELLELAGGDAAITSLPNQSGLV